MYRDNREEKTRLDEKKGDNGGEERKLDKQVDKGREVRVLVRVTEVRDAER